MKNGPVEGKEDSWTFSEIAFIHCKVFMSNKKMYFAVCSFLYSVVAYFLMITCLVYLTGNPYAQTTFFTSY